MLTTRVMPCLLLKGWGLVKTVKFKNPSYVGDPVNTVRIFNKKEVDELIFLDIVATNQKKSPPFQIIEEIASECFMPIAYGGGVRSIDDIKKIFNLGVEKVAINSYAVEDPTFIKKASEIFGSQSIIVSIDVKKNFWGKYWVYTNGGQKATKFNPVDFAQLMEEMGAGEVLLTSIDRDGTFEGYDTTLINSVSNAIGIPVIASGGAGSPEDFRKAVEHGGASAVAAGSMVVYQGPNRAVLVNFPDKSELDEMLSSVL